MYEVDKSGIGSSSHIRKQEGEQEKARTTILIRRKTLNHMFSKIGEDSLIDKIINT